MPPGDARRTACRVAVAVSDERGRTIAPALGRWLADVAPARARGLVNVALVSDHTVRALNSTYRGIDEVTDVLSFPATEPASSQTLPVGQRLLGDIVIARGVARRQASAAAHREATELRVLALHGLLHLLGYDHERDNGRMARLERRLRRRGGLREGLLERQ